MALNVRQQRFVDGILAGKNATEAYRQAGYAARGHVAEAAASRLLRHVEVASEIERRRAVVEKRVGITAESVLRRLDQVADRCMEAEPVMEFDHAEKAMVQKTAMISDGPGKPPREVGLYEFDSAGANRALELLGKHLKLFTDKVEHSGDVGLAERLARARERVRSKP